MGFDKNSTFADPFGMKLGEYVILIGMIIFGKVDDNHPNGVCQNIVVELCCSTATTSSGTAAATLRFFRELCFCQ
jgi:hypothetical protein